MKICLNGMIDLLPLFNIGQALYLCKESIHYTDVSGKLFHNSLIFSFSREPVHPKDKYIRGYLVFSAML